MIYPIEQKIDEKAVKGLLGIQDSLAYKIHEIEKHFHNKGIWFGSGAVEDNLTPYTLVSGNNDFGSEVLLLDTGDTPFRAGNVYFDIRKIEVTSVDTASPYYIRIIYGSGTVGEAEIAKQYSTLPITPEGVGAFVSGKPILMTFNRVRCGIDKIWAKCKNVTNAAEVNILIGLHEYSG